MIPNPILFNDNVIMIVLVACCVFILAAVMIPKAIRHRKQVKQNETTKPAPEEQEATKEKVTPIEKQEIEMVIIPTDKISFEKSMADYKRRFVVHTKEPRSNKTVGIRTKYHKRIAQIVEFIGDDDVSIFSYLDNVLKHHFETYHNEISEHYKNYDDDYLLPKS
mgnify:CR=1 FL=1